MPRVASWFATMRRRWRRVSGAGAPTRHPSRLPYHMVNYTMTFLATAGLSRHFWHRPGIRGLLLLTLGSYRIGWLIRRSSRGPDAQAWGDGVAEIGVQ